MELNRLSDDGDVVRLEVADRTVQCAASPDMEPMGDMLGSRGFAGKALLSLLETEFIDSSGLWWLLLCHKRFTEAGGKLVIHSVPGNVLDTMLMMRLEAVLQLADDEPAALELVRGDST